MRERVLPRLLYVADVPVEASYHGSALIYRLLQRYPADRLRIVEGNLFRPGTDRRLSGVKHETLRLGWRRLLNSRFHDVYSTWLLIRARSRVGQLCARLDGYAPQAVLTIAHGFSWVTAAHYAAQERLPLVVIVHDDWPRVSASSDLVDREFARVYRQAAARLCVSPYMAEEYQRRYGVPGAVLLPARAPNAKRFEGCAERLQRDNPRPVVAFAGTINSPGMVRLLQQAAARLAQHEAVLSIFGPLTSEQAAAAGLTAPNIRLEGLLPSDALLDRLRNEADVLFVPMSFDAADRSNMRMSFPSKLTDYTTVGLPLLICGPEDCSAVRWAHENPGVAEVVATDDAAALGAAIDLLCGERERRIALATMAQRIGDRDFSAEKAEAILYDALVA